MPLMNEVVQSQIRTQKARGIWKLDWAPWTLLGQGSDVFGRSYVYLIQSEDDIAQYAELTKGTLITTKALAVRPCPKNPAHGFVETEIVALGTAHASLMQLIHSKWKAAQALDPDAEIVIMPFFPSKLSSVYVANGVFSIGEGYDGVTSGKSGYSMLIAPNPGLLEAKHKYGIKDIVNEDGTTELAQVFLEIGYDAESHKVVQARGGPDVGAGRQSVPNALLGTEIKQVYTVTLDVELTDWKNIVEQELAHVEGLAVWCKSSTLTSHIAIHCVGAKIPIYCYEDGHPLAPVVGDKFQGEPVPFHAAGVRAGISKAFLDMQHCGSRAEFSALLRRAFFLMRNSTLLTSNGTEHGYRLAAYGVELVTLGAALAVIGEGRRSVAALKGTGVPDKSSYYVKWMKRPKEFWNRASLAALMLNHDALGGSIGGMKWVEAGLMTLKIQNRVTLCTEDGWLEAVKLCNILVDMVHNTGWLLNKFCSTDDLDAANNEPYRVAQWGTWLYEIITQKLTAKQLVKPRTERLSDHRSFSAQWYGNTCSVRMAVPELGGEIGFLPLDKNSAQVWVELLDEA